VTLAVGSGFVWVLGERLAAPVPRSIGAAPASLPGAESIHFDSGSGSHIAAWFAAHPREKGAVVLAHAVRSSRLSMRRRAEFLYRARYSVLLFDAQAHGESPGERITFGHLEALDAAAAVDFVRGRSPGVPVGYIGVSQGGAAALLGPAPLQVDALVIEAVYPTLAEALENRMAIRLGPLGPALAPLLGAQLGPRLGLPGGTLEPIARIGEVQAPLLVIAGAEDAHTTLEQSRRLFAAAPDPKELWIISGARHQDFHRLGPAEYEARVLEFLEAHLSRPAREGEDWQSRAASSATSGGPRAPNWVGARPAPGCVDVDSPAQIPYLAPRLKASCPISRRVSCAIASRFSVGFEAPARARGSAGFTSRASLRARKCFVPDSFGQGFDS